MPTLDGHFGATDARREPRALLSAGASTGGRLRSANRYLDRLWGLGWAVSGFLLGAAFWHLVGFWGFVSDVVLAGHSQDAIFFAETAQILPTTREAASTLVTPQPCVSLRLDRKSGLTSAVACEDSVPFRADSFEGREDRVEISTSVDSWVAPHAPARSLGITGR